MEPKEKLLEALKQIPSSEEFAIGLATRDAIQYGYGILVVDKDGNIIYVDWQEAINVAEAIKQNEAQGNRE